MKSTGLQTAEEIKNKMSQVLGADEQVSKVFVEEQCTIAKNQRDLRNRNLNYLNFEEDDQACRDLRNSFLRPKLNDDEVRLNTGTVEKKTLAVVNEILGYNFTPEMVAFDNRDREVQELGDVCTNLNIRTSEQEKSDDIDFLALWDLATRRITYFQEYWDDSVVVNKRKQKYDLENGIVRFDKQEYREGRPRKRLIDPRCVYAGDITIPPHLWDEQPFVVLKDKKNYRNAKSIFGKFKNWKYVLPGANSGRRWYGGEFDWRFNSILDNNSVELLWYFSYPDDEMQLLINDVPMFPPATPLSWEYPGYNIRPFVYREMSTDYLYGQLFTVNSRVWAGLKDEMLRLVVRRFRQAVEPPIAYGGTNMLSRDIFEAGAIVKGLKPDQIGKIIDSQGLSQGENAILETVIRQVDEEVGISNLFQGLTEKGLTATQVQEQMRQAIKSIGLLVFAWQRVKRDMAIQRIYNIFENGTNFLDVEMKNGKPEKVYRSYTINNAELENGLSGTKVIYFTDRQRTEKEMEETLKTEDELQEKGKNVRFQFLNTEKCRTIPINWFVNVVPKEKESTALQKMMFKEELNDRVAVSQVTGRPINGNSLIEKYERTWRSYNAFQETPPEPIIAPEMAASGQIQQKSRAMQNKIRREMMQGVDGGVPSPSVNTLQGQTV